MAGALWCCHYRDSEYDAGSKTRKSKAISRQICRRSHHDWLKDHRQQKTLAAKIAVWSLVSSADCFNTSAGGRLDVKSCTACDSDAGEPMCCGTMTADCAGSHPADTVPSSPPRSRKSLKRGKNGRSLCSSRSARPAFPTIDSKEPGRFSTALLPRHFFTLHPMALHLIGGNHTFV